MKFRPTIPYPENEKRKLDSLEGLFRDWHQHFVNNRTLLTKHDPDDMVFDGFYPYYSSQKKRVLFIGRESRQIGGFRNMDVLYEAYRNGKRIGNQSLDANLFHYRMLYVAYGIEHGFPAWQEIPKATVIGDSFGTANGLSFAFMNISKLSNEADESAADWPVINAAYALSTQSRNFIREQVAILEPDVIITMNLLDHLEDGLDSLGKWNLINGSHDAICYWLDIDGHRSLLVDTWHFSARNKEDIAVFYNPICNAIQSGELGSIKSRAPSHQTPVA